MLLKKYLRIVLQLSHQQIKNDELNFVQIPNNQEPKFLKLGATHFVAPNVTRVQKKHFLVRAGIHLADRRTEV